MRFLYINTLLSIYIMKTKRNKTIKLYITNKLKIKYNSKQFKSIYFIIYAFYEKNKLIYPNYDENKILDLYDKQFIKKNNSLIINF